MPKTITGAGASYDNTATVPVDTDLASAASVETPFQRVLNNLKFLYDLVFTNGVRRMQSVVDTTALRALTTMVDGDMCNVGGSGIYTFAAGATVPSNLPPFLIKPLAGGGGWFHENYALIGAAGGLPYLDATTKLTAVWIPNRIVSINEAQGTYPFSTSSTTAVDITGLTTTIACVAGDILMIAATCPLIMTAGVGDFDVYVSAGGGNTRTLSFNSTAGSPPSTTILWKFTVGATGNVTVKCRLSVSNGANTASIGVISQLVVQQIRP